MASPGMVLRCSKTGRIFFTQEEATEHAEAFGAAYANFDEVAMDAKVWICVETGRPAYSEAEVSRMKARDPDAKTWEEKTVAYLKELQEKKEKASQRKNNFLDSVDSKKLQALTEVKGFGRNRAAKALHFTKEKNTLEAAEAWLNEHKDDPTADKVDDEFLDGIFGSSADVVMADAGSSGDVVMAEAADEPDDRKEGDPNPEEIKEKVNKELLTQVMEMGFSELRAEKALYKVDNAGVEHAINWLSEHAEDADIDLPLKKPKAMPVVPEKPKMSKEEAEAKALELQKKLRQKRAEEEKLSEKEKERMRIESTKMMQEANEKLKEEERKRAFAQMAREKEEHERHKSALKEQLRLDYINRFGCEPPPEEEVQEAKLKDKPLREQLLHWLQQLKKTYKDSNREGLIACLTVIKAYSKNLKENPAEPKFKTLKVENKAFQAKIAPFEGATDLLEVLGFDNKGDVFQQRTAAPDGFLLGEAIKFIDLMLGQL